MRDKSCKEFVGQMSRSKNKAFVDDFLRLLKYVYSRMNNLTDIALVG